MNIIKVGLSIGGILIGTAGMVQKGIEHFEKKSERTLKEALASIPASEQKEVLRAQYLNQIIKSKRIEMQVTVDGLEKEIEIRKTKLAEKEALLHEVKARLELIEDVNMAKCIEETDAEETDAEETDSDSTEN